MGQPEGALLPAPGLQQFTSDPKRWVVLGVFGLCTFVNAFTWIMYSPIERESQEFFATNDTGINFFSLVFMLMYFPGTLLSNYHREKFGLRFSLLVGHGLTTAGLVVKSLACAIPQSAGSARYAVALVGQMMAAVGQPYFTNMPASIAGNWFPTNQRDMATIVAALLNPLGNAAGSAIPGFVVTSPDKITPLTLTLTGLSLVLMVVAWASVADKPHSPPSAAAAARSLLRSTSIRSATTPTPGAMPPGTPNGYAAVEEEHGVDHLAGIDPTVRMWVEAKQLLNNRNFLVLATGFGIGLGLFNAFLTLIAQMIRPCGYSGGVAGITGGALIGAGLVAAAIAGPVLEQTKAYVPLLKGGIVASVGGVLFMLLSLRPGHEAQLVVSFAVMGFGLLPLLPIVLENAAELTYPIPEDSSGSVLMNIGQVMGVLFTLAIQHTIPDSCDSVWKPSSILIFLVLVFAAVVLMFFKEDYQRQAAEQGAHPGGNLSSSAAEGPLPMVTLESVGVKESDA